MLPPVIFSLYLPVPTENNIVGRTAKVGSAIVGSPSGNGSLVLDYEGSLHGAVNLKRFADRAAVAAGRHASRYATVARMTALESEVIEVGWYDDETGEVTALEPSIDALLTWVGCTEEEWETERLSSAARHEMHRELVKGLASDDPAVVQQHLDWARSQGLALPDGYEPPA